MMKSNMDKSRINKRQIPNIHLVKTDDMTELIPQISKEKEVELVYKQPYTEIGFIAKFVLYPISQYTFRMLTYREIIKMFLSKSKFSLRLAPRVDLIDVELIQF